MKPDSSIKKLAQTLLATTCLTVAAASSASAVVVNEGIDFGNNSSIETALGSTATQVNGSLCPRTCDTNDYADWFSIDGFTPGSSVSVTETMLTGIAADDFYVLNSSGGTLDQHQNRTVSDGPLTFSVTAPGDGILRFGVVTSNEGGNASTYSVSIGSQTPEPGTLSMGALALAAAATLKRKRNQKA